MFTNNALRAISEYGKKYLVGGPSSEDGFQDQQPRLMELEGLRLILGGGLLMRKFWAKEEQSEELKTVLDQEEINSISEETEAVLSGKDPSLSREEEQLLLPGGRGSVVSNRDVQLQVGTEQLTSNRDVDVQVETEPVSKTDVTVQTDEDTEIEDLRLKNEIMTKELANKQAVIQENTEKMFQLNEELDKVKKEIEAHVELKSILQAENEDLKKSNEERSFLNEKLALEKIKLEKELVEEAVFTITKKNEGLREQLENKGKREKNLNGKIVRMTNTEDQMKKELSAAKDVISSLKKELQKRDLEKVKKEEGTGDEGSPGKEKCGLDKTSVVEGDHMLNILEHMPLEGVAKNKKSYLEKRLRQLLEL
ncbi:ERC protein 2-like [Palaemon carinicauda]|uniref:ERC protein 2-like n=1 Tax=Palaemon carinicauda TaxID=392227 RepID=UPI0035B63E59